VAGAKAGAALRLSRGNPPRPGPAVGGKQAGAPIVVDKGRLRGGIPKTGSNVIDWMKIEGREVVRAGRLVCTLEDRTNLESTRSIRLEDFVSAVKSVAIEQSGPVRAVVRIEGLHKAEHGTREWLPFTV